MLCFLAACGGENVEPPKVFTSVPDVEVEESNTQDEAAKDSAETLANDALLNGAEEEKDNKLTIAILLPLTGSEAETGKALLHAATMAVYDAYNPNVRLVPYDTKADALRTEIVTKQAVSDGASVVIGPLLASNVMIAGDILAPEGITLIGFSNDSSVAASGRYIMGFMPETEVRRVVDYAYGTGLRTFSALGPYGKYGQRVQDVFGDTLFSVGGNIASVESYSPYVDAIEEPVKRLANYDERRKARRDEIRFLKSLNDDVTDEVANKLEQKEVIGGVPYDAVLLPEGGDLLKNLAPLLPYYEIDTNQVKLLGTGLWSDPTLLSEPPLQGAWFAGPQPEAPKAFLDRYKAMYAVVPPRISTLAYDAVSLVSYLAKEGNDEPNKKALFSSDVLMNKSGFSGVDGLFRFREDGTIERTLAVLEIRNTGFTVIDPAPDVFPSFGFSLGR